MSGRQKDVLDMYPGFKQMPVVYFTQLMALAMGLNDRTGFDMNYVDPRPLLKEKGLLEG